MTPGARVAAAIGVLDQIIDGTAAEQALTGWARGSRYAGSKDRAAVRDHVYDALRARRSLGDGDGRSLMLRLALRDNWPVDTLFSGDGHAPAPVSPDETGDLSLSDAARCDIPDWLWPAWHDSLGPQAETVAHVQQGRAEVFLRVNTRRATPQVAAEILANDGVETVAHPTVAGCLQVTKNLRRVKTAAAYLDGVVELQDAASQFAIAQVKIPSGGTILDYCAGGGGKALGFADQHDTTVFAHDVAPARMRDLPQRAARAGVAITCLPTERLADHGPFDVVFCDAPCSGAGTWRRTPDAKWRFTAERLQVLMQSQDDVLEAASRLVKAGGVLAYATCSVLKSENSQRVRTFLKENGGFSLRSETQLLPSRNGDGFYLALLYHA